MKTKTRGASSRHGDRSRTKDASSGKTSKARRGTDWDRLRRLSDAEIRKNIGAYPEVGPTDEQFWKNAKVVLPRRKEVVTMRLDADLLEWFRQQEGYQCHSSRIHEGQLRALGGACRGGHR